MATARSESGTRRYTQNIVYQLARSIRERDMITYDHCRRVAIYANRLAHQMGWPRYAGRDLALAGLVHDLGKTWIQNAVLHKESALSSDERHEMERHPATAARMLQAYNTPDMIVESVLHHHEAYNGSGYPNHLAGEDIPLGARLLAVADVFDALASDRPYKSAMDVATACERIKAGAGSHFDPEVVEAFLTVVASRPDFCIPQRVSPLTVPAMPPRWTSHDVYDI